MMTDFQRIILVHYHEIGLKGHNRSQFEMRLLRNLEKLLSEFPLVTIHRIAGRLLVFLKEGTDYETANACADWITGVPGVARVSCGYKCERSMEAMSAAAIEALREALEHDSHAHSFKVSARRNHTDFPIDSMQLNRDIGAVLCEAYPDLAVRMKDPAITVGVEVVQNASYVYARSIRGVGGLPVGSAGKLVCLLSSGIDSPVATWRMARRGGTCIGVHFSGRPQTSDASEFLVRDIAGVLARTGCISKVFVVPFGDYQRGISLAVPPSLRIIIYRRLMFRTAFAIARREGAKGLVTGESLGQVASQTIENMAVVNAVVPSDFPVLRPLCGTDKLEIIDEAKRLGTFELSSQDAPDCCTLFMPRSPETHAKLADVEAAEADLPIAQWVEELAQAAELQFEA